MRQGVRSRKELVWAVGILLLALAVRGSGRIGWHLPWWSWWRGCDRYVLSQVTDILQSGNPFHFEVFYYPPVPAIIVATVASVWRLLGGGAMYSLCGAIGLMFSLATVGVMFMLGRFWGRMHGLIAMALYGVSMIAVVVTENVQVYSTFFLALAMYSVVRAATEGGGRPPTLAGVWLGLGVASKYLPLFFTGLLFVPYALRRWTSGNIADRSECVGLRAEREKLVSRVWVAGLWALVGLALTTLCLSIAAREFAFGLLRHIYYQHAHENPFEYHLPWINRLYKFSLVGVSLAGLTGALLLLVPSWRKASPWEWARSKFARNRLWAAPCIALVVTVAISLGLPAILNLNSYLGHSTFNAKAIASGDNGFFPGFRPAPSYIGAFIPENMGLPLFALAIAGLLYSVIRKDKKAVLLIASAFPPYVVLELSRVKVNRYAMELLPLFCLLAATCLGDLYDQPRKAWRVVGRFMLIGIVAYSTLYSVAWAEFFGTRNVPQAEAGKWLVASVPSGTPVGARSTLLVTGSPASLPSADYLVGYRLTDYADEPEFVLLPNAVHAIMLLYLDGLRTGYVYNADDWYVSVPTIADLAILSRIVREDGYVLVKDFKKRPRAFGVEFGSDSLTGRTMLVEHSSGVGLKIYRRVAKPG